MWVMWEMMRLLYLCSGTTDWRGRSGLSLNGPLYQFLHKLNGLPSILNGLVHQVTKDWSLPLHPALSVLTLDAPHCIIFRVLGVCWGPAVLTSHQGSLHRDVVPLRFSHRGVWGAVEGVPLVLLPVELLPLVHGGVDDGVLSPDWRVPGRPAPPAMSGWQCAAVLSSFALQNLMSNCW